LSFITQSCVVTKGKIKKNWKKNILEIREAIKNKKIIRKKLKKKLNPI
jgi:hypothetical protein